MDTDFRKNALKTGVSPFRNFVKEETFSGVLLIVMSLFALYAANSLLEPFYTDFWNIRFTVGPDGFQLQKPLWLWVSEGLMTFHFFVVCLEIKREILVGELALFRRSLLPIVAAVGGMVLPALLYILITTGENGYMGWGVPMATDLPFALGILSLLGKRVPFGLKVFFVSMAIVADIGAVIVIGLFYTIKISYLALFVALLFSISLLLANLSGVRYPLVYTLLGIGLWTAILKSGIHATIAGVIVALMIPARNRINADEFVSRGKGCIDEFERLGKRGREILANRKQHEALLGLERSLYMAQSPLQRFEETFHPWVAYFIIPLFALANAGVTIEGSFGEMIRQPVSLGIILGLVVGKQLGIFLSVWVMVKTGLSTLSRDVSLRHIYGVSCLGGIGFTMSLFIAGQAFGGTELLHISKIGILIASLLSAVIGVLVLITIKPDTTPS